MPLPNTVYPMVVYSLLPSAVSIGATVLTGEYVGTIGGITLPVSRELGPVEGIAEIIGPAVGIISQSLLAGTGVGSTVTWCTNMSLACIMLLLLCLLLLLLLSSHMILDLLSPHPYVETTLPNHQQP